MKSNRNIGGSFLPSSSPEILKSIQAPFGVLQVRPFDEEDTHKLFLNETVLASHPNGYSCHELAKRMISGNLERVENQAKYIVDCGGTCLDIESLSKLIK